MAIQKEVILQLKVLRPQDGKALADAAKQAKDLDTSLKSAGLGASKALADATTNARRFRQEVTAGNQAMARGGPGGVSGGGGGLTGFLGQNVAGMSLGRLGAMQMGMGAIQAAGQAARQAFATTSDAQIQAMVARESPWSSMAGQTVQQIPLIGGLASVGSEFASHGPRAAATESQRRLQRQIQNLERARQRQQIVTAGELSQAELAAQSGRDARTGNITGRAGFLAAGERARQMMDDARLERINRQFGAEMDAAGRGEGLGGSAMAAMRGEIGRRGEFGTAERFRIAEERRAAQSDLARLQRPTTGQDQGGLREADRLRQVEDARRRILDLERQDVELTRQAGENENQRLERIRQFFQAAEQGYQRIAEHERQRITNFREQFGLMDELGRMEVQQLAQRAAAGGGRGIQGLSSEELRSLQGTGLFDEQIRGEASRRGNLAGAQAIIQASGAQGRVEAAEARQREAAAVRVQVENQMQVNLQVSATDLARQFNDQVLPAIQQLFITATARMQQQLEAAMAERERQIALQNQGQQ